MQSSLNVNKMKCILRTLLALDTTNCSVSDNDAWAEDEVDAHNHHHTIPYNSTTNLQINVSQYNFPKEIWTMLPPWEIIVKASAFVPVILFGVIGNFILLNIIIRNRALRTPTNLLIANLAAADTATLLVCPLMFMFHDFFQNYMLGASGCKIEGFLEGALLITAVLNLSAVSYDRLTAIVLPLETRLTVKGAQIVMACTWVFGFLIATPLAIYRTFKERQWKNFLEAYCSENREVLAMYWHVLIAALVWFPLAVMIVCYSAIFHKLDQYEQQVLKREHPISVSYKTKVAKMLFIVVVAFVVLRIPFTTLVFVRNQMLIDASIDQVIGSFEILWYTSHYLIFLSSAVNPAIYGLTNDNFRRAYNQTPIFSFLRKPPLRQFKKEPKIINGKKMLYGNLQPRGPCGDDRFFNFKTLFAPNEKNGQAITISKITKSTQIRAEQPASNTENPKIKGDSSVEKIISNGFM